MRQVMATVTTQHTRFSAEHQKFLNQPMIQFMDMPGKGSVTSAYTYENYTLEVATAQYIAKGTRLHQFSLDLISKGCNYTDADTDYNIVRLFSYMVNNGKGTLRYYLSQLFYYFEGDFDREFTTKSTTLEVLFIIDPVIEVLLLLMFIPFILKVQKSLQRIYLHICQFHTAELKRWLGTCNSTSADLRASITQMQRMYNYENFEINLAEYEKKKETPSEPPKQSREENLTVAPGAGSEKEHGENEGEEQEQVQVKVQEQEEEAMVSKSHEAVVTHRKQERFSEMAREKTKTYLGYLLFLIVYIAIFKIVDGIMLSSLGAQKDEALNILELFDQRAWEIDNSMFFFRVNIMSNSISSYFGCKHML